jgi:RNA polymerase sigma-70 factor (ECF subfamily)
VRSRIFAKHGRGGLTQERAAPVGKDVPALWREGRIEEARLLLVHTTQRSVYRFLKAMVRDEDAAQDLTQDTFVRAFQSLGSFRGQATPTTWILTIARNLALNRARRKKLENRWQVTMDSPPDAADTRAVIESGEPGLMTALWALPPAQREAMVLYYVEDLGINEVVRLTGRSTNTIKSDLHRGRATLRAALEESTGPSTRPMEQKEPTA